MLCSSLRFNTSRFGKIQNAREFPYLSQGCSRVGIPRSVSVQAIDVNHITGFVDSVSQHHVNLLAVLADGSEAVPPPPEGDSGPFDFIANGLEALLKAIDAGLEGAHVPYSYGFAIITLTVLVKLATFPLTQKQVQSSVAVQALQPRVKELQARYASEPENLQIETARLYKEAGVNPLAGCLPTLATIPVFIGLYKALTNAADEGLGQESFFWIPDLSGPATMTQRATGAGLSWLFPFVDGHPPIGWSSAAAYLAMPALLIVSQYASMKLMSPPVNKDDPQASQTQAILKVLPLMIGWFSLNVPSGLTLYWFINNILSTAQQVYLKKTTQINIPQPVASTSAAANVVTIIKPKEERVKKVTGKDIGARRKRDDGSSSDSDVIDVEASVAHSNQAGSSSGMDANNVVMTGASSSNSSSLDKDSKGEKFRALKAREAATKASARTD
ncbi:hypothetical protein CEUSTIGMA_g7915.t1 [Chlamydomonas eustigma]|uniref:Membrane insertase YidC/Oxa/ALB C-terminal domain-containing protein n=1 Tax=Chlamydomonas eustigma TaxID=1157962 RepID=A0A250XBN9_9CHLO|nr:hypothetical protein CEUSTIGMA_g7915.t1 [Chlamydomonas eustigma]|eukprot:GAX80476.1 hypothetical protein CEUSTIGMA_g7915.t1 [Chlamydomonas eustigma]